MQDIAWRVQSHEKRHQLLANQVSNNQNTHIVREVLVRGRQYRKYGKLTLARIEDAIADTEEEFELLRGCGVQIADVDWHELKSSTARNYPNTQEAKSGSYLTPLKVSCLISDKLSTLTGHLTSLGVGLSTLTVRHSMYMVRLGKNLELELRQTPI